MPVHCKQPNEALVLSRTPGRLRVQLPGGSGKSLEWLQQKLSELHGISSVRLSPLTGNLLVQFDARVLREESILTVLQRQSEPEQNGVREQTGPDFSTAPLIRVGVRGLLGHACVDALWFGAGFLGKRLGLPLAGLGPLHLLLDVFVWVGAMASAGGSSPTSTITSRA